ncbi:MAG: lysine--tRNA ligase [Deltaproteobacteria bacterium]|nr:lysine--tRNA ligase [Deltaproteobacteria bacterium]
MLWCDQVASELAGPQLINDSKTPSGRVHVGALRGVLIHDAVFRAIKDRGLPVRYTFGVDDYDPLDELPVEAKEFFTPYLGAPLCNVPAPPGSSAPDIAEHYIREFFDIFGELGVEAETYRLRDVYRSGRFNEAIDAILHNAATVRRVYLEVSNSQRAETWYPFQTVCEQCGRIGTTEVTGYDGKEVEYTCRANLVTWARGCNYSGKVSPFDGRGKLPWKLEWTAKWRVFPITVEGAGKDHTTKGGSREVAAACLREIFGQQPPLNIPYEFFLVGGAKMSSSRGVGAAAREIADLLPPEILRFLMMKTKPKQPVNFSPDEKSIVKLFNEFDRLHWRTFHDPKITAEEQRVHHIAEIQPEGDFYEADFQLVATILQMPHLNLVHEIEKRKGSPLTAIDLRHLERRVESARYWLKQYASDEEKTALQETLPERARALTATQRAFLHQLATVLPATPWEDDALQTQLFAVARSTPIAPAQAFQAIYRVLIDRESGPKAGNLIAFLEPGFVVKRFTELPYTQEEFWRETAVTEAELEAWLAEQRAHITGVGVRFERGAASGVVEFSIQLDDQKQHTKRVLRADVETAGRAYVEELGKKYELPVAG